MASYTLRQLEYFVATAEAGSVTGAAERIHLSQSALSAALADLECALDVQLLMRHHARGVTVTPAGERLLATARTLLSQADDLQASASELAGQLTGTLRVGCFSVLAPYVLPELLAAAAAQYPGLEVEATEDSLDALEAGLLSGRFELALAYDLGFGAGVTRQPLFSVPPYVLLPADHSLARRRKVRLAQLADEPMVLLDLPHSREYFLGMFAQVSVEPVVRYRTRSVELARALVGRGLAYTVLNLRPALDVTLDGHRVKPVGLADGTTPLDVVLITARGMRPTRRAEVVARLCRGVLEKRRP